MYQPCLDEASHYSYSLKVDFKLKCGEGSLQAVSYSRLLFQHSSLSNNQTLPKLLGYLVKNTVSLFDVCDDIIYRITLIFALIFGSLGFIATEVRVIFSLLW